MSGLYKASNTIEQKPEQAQHSSYAQKSFERNTLAEHAIHLFLIYLTFPIQTNFCLFPQISPDNIGSKALYA